MQTRRRYDRSTTAEIIASPEFAPLRDLPGLAAVPPRELKTLRRFLVWAAARGIETPVVADLCAFAADDGSSRALADLRLALGKILPEDADLRVVVQEAIRDTRPRSRRCDWRGREAILAGGHFDGYRDLPGMAKLALEELRVLDRFLVFAAGRLLEIPGVEDFLAFSADTGSPRRLRLLEAALLRLMPGNPAVLLTLREAILRKAPSRARATPARPRAAEFSLPLAALPQAWQDLLSQLHQGDAVGEFDALAESTVKNMAEVLRGYARTLADAGLPPALSLACVRLHEAALRARAARPATLHTVTMRLRQFGQRVGAAPELVAALRTHETVLRRALGRVVPLKPARLAALPELRTGWRRAVALLKLGSRRGDRTKRQRQRNEAFVLAFWSLIPLRLEDGGLTWGREVTWDGNRYRLDLITHKKHVALRGRLHPRLTPFLDALLLEGVSEAYLPEMRDRAQAANLPLLRGARDLPLATDYPSTVWRKHWGTGAHIARTRIHTELGRLGPQGVDSALALCAQRDPRTRLHYQGLAVAEAEMCKGQDLTAGLHDEFDPEDLTAWLAE